MFLIEKWMRFYWEVLGVTFNPSSLVSSLRPEFPWIIPVYEGVTCRKLFDICRVRFGGNVWKYYDDLDEVLIRNDRLPTKTYTVCVRGGWDVDEEYRSLSVETVDEMGVKGVTLTERLLLELWYHWMTNGGHLDTRSLTLCTGSRTASGKVPLVFCFQGQFRVGSFVGPKGDSAFWGVREVEEFPL